MLGDPDTILDWLQIQDETRECQLLALEQLCQDILFSDNIDNFFASYSPNSFLPALCEVLMDETAPDNVLETAARALTYFLDVSSNILRLIFKVKGFIKAICRRLDFVDMHMEKSNELSQQILKLLSLLLAEDPTTLYAGGSLPCVLRYVKNYSHMVHSDVLRSGMDIIQRLCAEAEPNDSSLSEIFESLIELIGYTEASVSDNALKALGNLVERFGKKSVDTSTFVTPQVVDKLLTRLRVAGGVEYLAPETTRSVVSLNPSNIDTFDDFENSFLSTDPNAIKSSGPGSSNPAVVNSITNILLTICCNSPALTRQLLVSEGCLATTLALIMVKGEESIILSVMRLAEVLLVLLYEVKAYADCPTANKSNRRVLNSEAHIVWPSQEQHTDRTIIWECDLAYLKLDTENENSSAMLVDNLGQHVVHWLVAYGSIELFEFALANGIAFPDEHQTPCAIMSALDYAIEMGRVDFCRLLLQLKSLDFWFSLPKKSFFNPLERARYASNLTDGVRMDIVQLLTPHLEDCTQEQVLETPALKSRSCSPFCDALTPPMTSLDMETLRIQKIFVRQLITVVANVYRCSTHIVVKYVHKASILSI
ncbi:hypothetical protein Ciccas_008509 [Cichlidogyrus casuarinus]|uniref:E3 ubiquitin-protein ligase n=1 Tax=Cichlidogyrus casuarinus TaxID=1844966 RepID=A0ABD2Q2E0_9PLAT